MSKILSTQEAAEYMGVDSSTIRKWILNGKLRAQRLSPRSIAIKQSDLDQVKLGVGGRGRIKEVPNSSD